MCKNERHGNDEENDMLRFIAFTGFALTVAHFALEALLTICNALALDPSKVF